MNSPCESCTSPMCNCDKEITPKSAEDCDKKRSPAQRWCNKLTPDRKGSGKRHNFSSPLDTIQEQGDSSDNVNVYLSTPLRGSQKVVNPFDCEVDSLHMSFFSPSVFSITTKKSDDDVFRWSIEQLAVLKPAEIDESSQQDVWVDSDKERRAQQAIDKFFSKGSIAPSPYCPTVKYSFAPHFASTACESSIEHCHISEKSGNTVATQTSLSIPPNLDLMSLLGHFYTYHVDSVPVSLNNSVIDLDGLHNTSLRRKLFINEEELSSPSLIKEQVSDESKYVTPELPVRRQCKTPSSDQFASSPITHRRHSISSLKCGVNFCSPDVSPISFMRSLSSEDSSRSEMKCQSPISSTKASMLEYQNADDSLNSQSMNSSCSELETMNSCPANFLDDADDNNHTSSQMYCNSSNQRDTGYLTGSLNSAPSLIGHQTHIDYNFRATPVAELLGDCAITKQNLHIYQEQLDCSKMSCDNENSVMMTSQYEL